MNNRRFGKRVNWQSHSSGSAPVAVRRQLEIDESLVVIDASEYPFTLDLKTKVKYLGDGAEINILSIQEYSDSGLATAWTSENKFLTIDEKGVLTYTPKGTYLDNLLVIEFEAADANHPPTAQARKAGDMYESFDPSAPDPLGDSQLSAVQGEAVIQVKNDILGDPEKEKEFHDRQWTGPSCSIASAASILKSLGTQVNGKLITYDDVLKSVAVQVDANGNVIGNQPPILTPQGVAEYTYYVKEDESIVVKRNTAIVNGVSTTLSTGWNITQTILTHFKQPSHIGYAKHFSTIVKELEAGNKVMAYVDAGELWQDDYFVRLWNRADAQPVNGPNGTSLGSKNHAIWITGIDYSDPNNIKFIINDTGHETHAGKVYPMEQFIAAWEDSNFIYTATGANTPDLSTQELRRDIDHALLTYFSADSNSSNWFLVRDHAFFHSYITNQDLLGEIEGRFPGTRKKIAQYLYNLKSEERRIWRKFNIDAETIASIYFNADIAEFITEYVGTVPIEDEDAS